MYIRFIELINFRIKLIITSKSVHFLSSQISLNGQALNSRST